MQTRTYEPSQGTGQAKVFWYLVTAYVADVVGLLDQEKAARLDELSKGYKKNWRYYVAQKLQADAEGVRKVYEQCLQHRDSTLALELMLRGLGCPDATQCLNDVLGER